MRSHRTKKCSGRMRIRGPLPTRVLPRWLIAATIVCWFAARAHAELSADAKQKIAQRVTEAMSQEGIPGLSLAIAVGNELQYEAGFGQADVENSVPARADSLYRTASIAKPMTAAVVMQLAEAGKLDLD